MSTHDLQTTSGIGEGDAWVLGHTTEFDDWFRANRGRLVEDLLELVRIETVSPHEDRAFGWLADYFRPVAEQVQLEPRHPDLKDHPAANQNAYLALPAEQRGTLRIDLGGTLGTPATLLSAHVDVVPAAPGFDRAFDPQTKDGVVIGRGTADTKGNIVMVAAAVRFLQETGQRYRRTLLDLVTEEEIGGNGALSACLHGRDVAEVVVLEPTALEVFHGHRGCVEATVQFNGRAGHMGGTGRNAILGATAFVGLVGELEEQLLAVARADPVFAGFPRPVQINVGRVRGGEWHGSIPEHCTVGISFGFHPSLDEAAVRMSIDGLLARLPQPWVPQDVEVRYEGIHNGAYVGSVDAPVAHQLRAAVRSTGASVRERRAWCVSCDARLYHELLGVPTVVFGAGRLEDAHSSHEHLVMDEWARGTLALAGLLAEGAGEMDTYQDAGD